MHIEEDEEGVLGMVDDDYNVKGRFCGCLNELSVSSFVDDDDDLKPLPTAHTGNIYGTVLGTQEAKEKERKKNNCPLNERALLL